MAGEMTPQEFAEMQGLIDQKVPNASQCLTCGIQNSVHLASHLVTPVATNYRGGILLQAANYPQAMLMCMNCGETRYFNAVILRGN